MWHEDDPKTEPLHGTRERSAVTTRGVSRARRYNVWPPCRLKFCPGIVATKCNATSKVSEAPPELGRADTNCGVTMESER
jgi:hypothetical protein